MKNNIHNEVKENKLLSICIPTYNRADNLKKTLDSIIGQGKFAASCEVIISDNNSSDNTKYIGEYFSDKYENIRYYRNETNVGAERNFLKLLNYGQGKYLKLHSDKSCFHENKLDELVEYLVHIDHNVIFLLNENTVHKNTGTFECSSLDEFVQIVSFFSTWMNGVIFKRSAYTNLKEKDRSLGSFLIHTDIMLRMISQSRKSMIINRRMTYETEVLSKGGYDFFKVFISNYLDLYDEYLKSALLSPETYKKEKTKLLKDYIFPWYMKFIFNSRCYYFDNNGNGLNIILKYYDYKSLLFFFPGYIIKAVLRKLSRFIMAAVPLSCLSRVM